MLVKYNALDSACKSIIGAIKEDTEFSLTVTANAKIVKLSLYEDKTSTTTEYKFTNTAPNVFSVTLSLKKGLYFYNIIVDGISYYANSNFEATTFGDNKWQLTVYDKKYKTPSWFKGGIMYQIFPDRFCRVGKDFLLPKNKIARKWGEEPYYKPNKLGKILNNDFFGGNFKGIESKLNYLKDLGVNVIYLNPITKAFSNHRYDTANYGEIDELLGSEKDFKSLTLKAEKLGIKIVLDGVFNHTGDDSVYFNKYHTFDSLGAYESKKSPYYDWYTFTEYPNKYTSWWGIDVLPTINKNSKKFEEYIAGKNGILEKYMDLGVSGYRLDVVDELPSSFVKKIRKTIKKKNPNSVLIGEVWEDATNKIAYDTRKEYFLGEELDSVMNYPLQKAIIDFLKNKNQSNLKSVILSQINNYPFDALISLMNILSTHDTRRILTCLGSNKEYKTREEMHSAVLSENELIVGKTLLKLAVVLQFMLYGTPCIYYGDESGMQGEKDPFNRRTFPWDNIDKTIHNFYKKMSQIRTDNNAIKYGETKIIKDEKGLIAFTRKYENEEILIAVNVSNNTYEIKTDSPKTNLFTESKGNKFTLKTNEFIIIK